jgi:TMEM175 potassium channel family protein
MTPNEAAAGTGTEEEAEARRVVEAEVELGSAERLAFFSDAVVAIAITLLALDLPVPGGGSNTHVLHELRAHDMEYLAFLISFAVIGSHWRGHHRLFGDVRRLGGMIVRLNLLWLMMIVVTPFVTNVLTVPNGGFQVRFGLYAVVQMLAGLLSLLMTREMSRHDLLRHEASNEVIPRSYRRSVGVVVTFGVSIPLSLVADRWAFVAWAAMPLTMWLAGRVIRSSPESHVTG